MGNDESNKPVTWGTLLAEQARLMTVRHLSVFPWFAGLDVLLRHYDHAAGRRPGRVLRREASLRPVLPSEQPPTWTGEGTEETATPDSTRWRLRDLVGPAADLMRVHRGAAADARARQHQAAAVTIGTDVFLRSDVPPPADPKGLALLAHEAAHVAESVSPRSGLQRASAAGVAAEEERAAEVAQRIVHPVHASGTAPGPRSPAAAALGAPGAHPAFASPAMDTAGVEQGAAARQQRKGAGLGSTQAPQSLYGDEISAGGERSQALVPAELRGAVAASGDGIGGEPALEVDAADEFFSVAKTSRSAEPGAVAGPGATAPEPGTPMPTAQGAKPILPSQRVAVSEFVPPSTASAGQRPERFASVPQGGLVEETVKRPPVAEPLPKNQPYLPGEEGIASPAAHLSQVTSHAVAGTAPPAIPATWDRIPHEESRAQGPADPRADLPRPGKVAFNAEVSPFGAAEPPGLVPTQARAPALGPSMVLPVLHSRRPVTETAPAEVRVKPDATSQAEARSQSLGGPHVELPWVRKVALNTEVSGYGAAEPPGPAQTQVSALAAPPRVVTTAMRLQARDAISMVAAATLHSVAAAVPQAALRSLAPGVDAPPPVAARPPALRPMAAPAVPGTSGQPVGSSVPAPAQAAQPAPQQDLESLKRTLLRELMAQLQVQSERGG